MISDNTQKSLTSEYDLAWVIFFQILQTRILSSAFWKINS